MTHRAVAGIDVGGTFTDLVAVRDDGHVTAHKVSSTPEDQSRAVEQALAELALPPARQLARVIFDIAVMDRDHRRLVFRLSGQSQARAEPDIASFSRGRRGLARVLQDVFQSEDGGRV